MVVFDSSLLNFQRVPLFHDFSHGFPMVFPWFSHGFPMVFPWFSRGFPMVFGGLATKNGDLKQAAFQTLGFARLLGGFKVWAVGLAGDVCTYQ